MIEWSGLGRKRSGLFAAVCFRRRGLPLLSWATTPEELNPSQNLLEEMFIRRLLEHLPDTIRPLLLADRGFGRASLLRFYSRCLGILSGWWTMWCVSRAMSTFKLPMAMRGCCGSIRARARSFVKEQGSCFPEGMVAGFPVLGQEPAGAEGTMAVVGRIVVGWADLCC